MAVASIARSTLKLRPAIESRPPAQTWLPPLTSGSAADQSRWPSGWRSSTVAGSAPLLSSALRFSRPQDGSGTSRFSRPQDGSGTSRFSRPQDGSGTSRFSRPRTAVAHLELLAGSTGAGRIPPDPRVRVLRVVATGRCLDRTVFVRRRIGQRPRTGATETLGAHPRTCYRRLLPRRELEPGQLCIVEHLGHVRGKGRGLSVVTHRVHFDSGAIRVGAGFDQVLLGTTVTVARRSCGRHLHRQPVLAGDDADRGPRVRLLDFHFEVEDEADDLLHERFHHGVEHVAALPLVLHQRVALRHRPQPNALAQVVHLIQVLAPLSIQNSQQDTALKLA